MASYRTISTAFWNDSKVEDEFTPEDKYFFLYLLTNKHTNLCGCYEISKRQMSKEMGYSVETIDNLLYRFRNIHNVIDYDEVTKEILIFNWHRYNWSSSELFIKGAKKVAHYIKNESYKEYIFDLLEAHENKEEVYPIYTVSYPMHTSVSVSDNNIYINNNTKVSDKEYVEDISNINVEVDKKVYSKEPAHVNKPKSDIDHAYDEPFKEFWDRFPRRRRNAKQECRRKYEAALKRNKGLTPQMLIDALERQKRSKDWTKDNGEFVPSPLTWLNQGRWEDDVYEGETENKGYVITEEDRLESL